MKAYVITSGSVFGLLTAAHIVRVVLEGARVARDPFFVGITLLAAVLTFWAWRVLRGSFLRLP